METSKHVRMERASGLLAMTLARPEKKNALTTPMYQALLAGLELASAEPSVQAVLLDAEGADFCAGNDIGDFIALAGSGSRSRAPMCSASCARWRCSISR